MQSDFDTAYRSARTHYEMGRLLRGLRHSALVAAVLAAASWLIVGKGALLWLPVTILAITFSEWRGQLLMQGARRGLVAGFAAMLLPLSILRPCCGMDAKAMGADCCTMPAACWAVGGAIGLLMSFLIPKAPFGRRAEAAVGMVVGVTSVEVLRCSMLFFGEAVGLLGGIAAAVVATSLARALLDRLRSTA